MELEIKKVDDLKRIIKIGDKIKSDIDDKTLKKIRMIFKQYKAKKDDFYKAVAVKIKDENNVLGKDSEVTGVIIKNDKTGKGAFIIIDKSSNYLPKENDGYILTRDGKLITQSFGNLIHFINRFVNDEKYTEKDFNRDIVGFKEVFNRLLKNGDIYSQDLNEILSNLKFAALTYLNPDLDLNDILKPDIDFYSAVKENAKNEPTMVMIIDNSIADLTNEIQHSSLYQEFIDSGPDVYKAYDEVIKMNEEKDKVIQAIKENGGYNIDPQKNIGFLKSRLNIVKVFSHRYFNEYPNIRKYLLSYNLTCG